MQISLARGGFTSECHIHLAQALCPAAMCRMMAAAHMGSYSDDDLWHAFTESNTHTHKEGLRLAICWIDLLDALNAVARKQKKKTWTKE